MEETTNARVPGRPGRRMGSGKRAGSEGAWGQRAVQALADPSRWRIVHELGLGPRSLGDLANRVGLSAACMSHHISILKEAELVVVRREARRTWCSIPETDSRAGDLLKVLAIEGRSIPPISNPRIQVVESIRPMTGAPELETASAGTRRTSGIDIEDYLL